MLLNCWRFCLTGKGDVLIILESGETKDRSAGATAYPPSHFGQLAKLRVLASW